MNDVVIPGATLLLGDSLERMREIESGSVDAVICDLPYGTTACAWDVVIPFAPLWEQYKRILKPRGVAVLSACQPFTTDLIASNRRWFRYEMIWEKFNGTGFLNANKMPLRAHENLVVFARGGTTYNPQFGVGAPYQITRKAGKVIETLGPKKAIAVPQTTISDGRRFPRTVLRFDRDRGAWAGKHPTQKPVALFRWLVRTYTQPGELVVDNTMGSGTTGVSAVLEGRRFLGIEKNPAYFATSTERVLRAAEEVAATSASEAVR